VTNLFSRFKQTVLSVDSNQKSQPVCPTDLRLEINQFADGKMIELVRPKAPIIVKRMR
jgi:hypothetical protein